MTKSYDLLLERQKNWAEREGIPYIPNGKRMGYTNYLASNLFYQTLSTMTVDEYSSSKGNEFQEHMKALYSSSALVVNVFEYWRQNNRASDIAAVFGKYSPYIEMRFEKTYPIFSSGKGTPPHLDIEFSGGEIKPLAIESKLTEPYRTTTQRNRTNLEKYLADPGIWRGLDKLKSLAEEIHREEGGKTRWPHLDAVQLAKHILGLSRAYQPNGFSLLYLWFDCGTDDSSKLLQEIEDFLGKIGSGIDFRSMTYQALFEQLKRLPDVDKRYLDYLEDRYFQSE